MERDFSEKKKQEFLALVKKYGDGSTWAFWNWDASDEELAEYLQKGDYDKYYQELFDAKNYTEKTINDIFNEVNRLDLCFQNKFSELNDAFRTVKEYLEQLHDSLGIGLYCWGFGDVFSKMNPAWTQLREVKVSKDALIAEAEKRLDAILKKPRSKWNDEDIYLISYCLIYSKDDYVRFQVFQSLYDLSSSKTSDVFVRDSESWNRIMEQSAIIFANEYVTFMNSNTEEEEKHFIAVFQNISVLSIFDSKCSTSTFFPSTWYPTNNLNDKNPEYDEYNEIYRKKTGINYPRSHPLDYVIEDGKGVIKFNITLDNNMNYSYDSAGTVSMDPIVATYKDAAAELRKYQQNLLIDSKNRQYDIVGLSLSIVGTICSFVPTPEAQLAGKAASILSLGWSVMQIYDVSQERQIKFFGDNLPGSNASGSPQNYHEQITDVSLSDAANYAELFGMICVVDEGLMQMLPTPQTTEEIKCFYAYLESKGKAVPEGEENMLQEFFTDYDIKKVADTIYSKEEGFSLNEYDRFREAYRNSQKNP